MGGLGSLFNRKKKRHTSTPTFSNNPPSLNPAGRVEEELVQVFKKLDVNGDGKISSSELGSIMSSLGNPTSDEELGIMIKEVDADGDGYIDLKEFIELNTKDVNSEDVLANLRDAFSVFDIDKNGSITAEELRKVLSRLGEECSLKECRKMIGGVDCDGDGMICFQEFKVMMMGSRFNATTVG